MFTQITDLFYKKENMLEMNLSLKIQEKKN